MKPEATRTIKLIHKINTRAEALVKNLQRPEAVWHIRHLLIFLIMLLVTLSLLHQAADIVQARYVLERRTGFTIRTPAANG